MNVSVIASTKPGYDVSMEEALNFSGKCAGICYMPENFETILGEPLHKTEARVKQTLNSKHHSVYGHASVTLLIEGIPKILAMVINNEKVYTTSEKSARYTKMQLSDGDQALYDKWMAIFEERIRQEYPELQDAVVIKLAQENARYTTSVFTPTVMAYTVSIQQLNYLRAMMKKYVADADIMNSFEKQLAECMKDFLNMTEKYEITALESGINHRSLSLFIRKNKSSKIETTYSGVYCTTYSASFAQVAQAQRHRTLDYKIGISRESGFYIPALIADKASLCEDWLNDLNNIATEWPQARLVEVVERGTVENFALKCLERCCNNAQLEVNMQTRATLAKFIFQEDEYVTEVFSDVGIVHGAEAPRCSYSGYTCTGSCVLGVDRYITRMI